MTLPLFDAGVPVPPPEREKTSPEVRRRERQAACLANGLHPLTAALGWPVRLHADAAPADDRAARRGLRCGGCRFREVIRYHSRSYPKCLHGWDGDGYVFDRAPRVSNGAGTDIRGWWPACGSYEPRAEQ